VSDGGVEERGAAAPANAPASAAARPAAVGPRAEELYRAVAATEPPDAPAPDGLDAMTHFLRAPADVAAAAQLACLLEASAPKPGNVSPGRHFHDTRYEDFLASAAAIGPALALAGNRPLGETIRAAVEATRRWTRSNTNLGIVLLLAPIARAALRVGGPPHRDHTHTSGFRITDSSRIVSRHADRGAPPRDAADAADARSLAAAPGATSAPDAALRDSAFHDSSLSDSPLRARVARVLSQTTVADAAELYAAIRLARPAGLGAVDAEDVREAPTVTLREAMVLAAARDGVAREYATGFAMTFEVGAPTILRARRDGLDWTDATVEAYLTLLATAPDTHVARKRGEAAANDISRRARRALDAGGVRSAAGRRAVAVLDRMLRDARNANNPGTTADLAAAAIFVALLHGGWRHQEESSDAHAD